MDRHHHAADLVVSRNPLGKLVSERWLLFSWITSFSGLHPGKMRWIISTKASGEAGFVSLPGSHGGLPISHGDASRKLPSSGFMVVKKLFTVAFVESDGGSIGDAPLNGWWDLLGVQNLVFHWFSTIFHYRAQVYIRLHHTQSSPRKYRNVDRSAWFRVKLLRVPFFSRLPNRFVGPKCRAVVTDFGFIFRNSSPPPPSGFLVQIVAEAFPVLYVPELIRPLQVA